MPGRPTRRPSRTHVRSTECARTTAQVRRSTSSMTASISIGESSARSWSSGVRRTSSGAALTCSPSGGNGLAPCTAPASLAAIICLKKNRKSQRNFWTSSSHVPRQNSESTELNSWYRGCRWPPPVLGQVDLNGTIVTAGALHTVTATAEFICDNGGEFALPVKENRQALFDALDAL